MITVIMAAGSGTRLWALSRTRFLNNFISRLWSKHVQQTVARLKNLIDDSPIVIADKDIVQPDLTLWNEAYLVLSPHAY